MTTPPPLNSPLLQLAFNHSMFVYAIILFRIINFNYFSLLDVKVIV